MKSVSLYNQQGKEVDKLELPAGIFDLKINSDLISQALTTQLANSRQSIAHAKDRSEVSGGGKKPFKQKGTGNARQGSIRAPHFSGGGVALGPKPRKYSQRTPKKMIQLALRSALSDRMSENKVVVVEDWGFDAPSTKAASAAITALGMSGRVMIVLERKDESAWKSFRNLTDVHVLSTPELNAYDILCNDWIVFTKASLPAMEAAK